MFNPIAPATEKMACTAVIPGRPSDVPSYQGKINRFERFTAERFFLVSRVSTIGREFFVSFRGIVTDEAVNAGFRVQIKVAVTPTIITFMAAVAKVGFTPTVSRMAAGAPAPVGLWRNSEIVDNLGFSESLLTFPGPVNGLMHLSHRFGVTGKTGLGHLGTTFKLPFQEFKFTMIRRWFRRRNRCRHLQDRCTAYRCFNLLNRTKR